MSPLSVVHGCISHVRGSCEAGCSVQPRARHEAEGMRSKAQAVSKAVRNRPHPREPSATNAARGRTAHSRSPSLNAPAGWTSQGGPVLHGLPSRARALSLSRANGGPAGDVLGLSGVDSADPTARRALDD